MHVYIVDLVKGEYFLIFCQSECHLKSLFNISKTNCETFYERSYITEKIRSHFIEEIIRAQETKLRGYKYTQINVYVLLL